MAQSNNPQTIKIVVAVFALVIAGFLVMNNSKPGGASNGQYFYDLGDSSVYVAKSSTLAPTTAPSGSVGVEAVIFACSTCDDAASHVVAYLTKYTDAYLEVLQSGEPPTAEQMKSSRMVRTVEGKAWLPGSSDAAMAITTNAEPTCPPDKPATVCQP